MFAGEIISKRVVTVGLGDSLETVKEIFDNVKFHYLLVVENGKLFGVLSDRDLLKALSPNIDTPRPPSYSVLWQPIGAFVLTELSVFSRPAEATNIQYRKARPHADQPPP